MLKIENLIGRCRSLFDAEFTNIDSFISSEIKKSTFLVVGAAGTIGKAVTREIFLRNPKLLHVVDISENNIVELVRDLRSSHGYTNGEFKSFAIDCGSVEFKKLFAETGGYDYVLNLSALKHVRSEKDQYTLMRLIEVNILNAMSIFELCCNYKTKKYFCVSTDKASSPVNMMGASKRIMELFLFGMESTVPVSTARFANVAFSDGSLLHGFSRRFENKQPLSAPVDIQRYFLTPQESGQLCLLSCLLGNHRETFFPKIGNDFSLKSFSDLALNYVRMMGFEPLVCPTEEQARLEAENIDKSGFWPVFLFETDTTGEKSEEEFYSQIDDIDLDRYENLGVILNSSQLNIDQIADFKSAVQAIKGSKKSTQRDLIDLFEINLPDFSHNDLGKNLDEKM